MSGWAACWRRTEGEWSDRRGRERQRTGAEGAQRVGSRPDADSAWLAGVKRHSASTSGPQAISVGPEASVGVVEGPGERESLRWEQHGERTVYESPWVQVTRVDVTPPDGNRFEHHAVRLKKVATAVVLDSEDRVLLVWRHRFITNSWGWETPGGIVDEGETGEQAAIRETVEETGWRPEGLRLLAAFQPMPGLVDTPHEVYLSRRAVKVGEPSDAVEAGVVRWVPVADVPALIERGEIAGSGSLVGLLCAARAAGSREAWSAV